MGKGKGHIPVRTCITCGAKRSKYELIRMVLDGETQLARDDKGKGPGRGAYVCRTGPCREKLSRQRNLQKIFRSKGPIKISPALWTR